ncbi:hypothetical protein OU787_08910 [Kitasatospora sp. YST-16]|uniref:hypothetical protein n=1 Tax=Kitasatospora sp. YST-16 TaxID=2998080 RepID=UPI002284FF31|nr:hypothetical protein [Kitasatospora sp. YST-16]WAL71615.1 hypothetical protein OU787_08910 [Kitasatospora sp. YST-16]WNW37653.1 hypothetical protein RKE32_08860 [Streptomyces sp. Li-HN-5-13]
MGKYMDDTLARQAWDAAAGVASWRDAPAVPFTWSGARWETPAGEWRDLALIRRGMGEWLANLAGWLRYENYEAMTLAERKAELERGVRKFELDALMILTDAGAKAYAQRQADALRREAAGIDVPPMTVELVEIEAMEAVSGEMLSATDARATQLLSLASQFDAFRALMRDPADWVSRLVPAPRSEHVRTSLVWEAFTAAEPVLAGALGSRTGKRLLFAAMDKRFGARRKLGGYDGWRGVALTG